MCLGFITEEGGGMNGPAQAVCAGMLGDLHSQPRARQEQHVGISDQSSLLQAVLCVTDCTLMPMLTG